MMSRIAGFQCPCCGVELPFKQTRERIRGAMKTGKLFLEDCASCGKVYTIRLPSQKQMYLAVTYLVLANLAVAGLALALMTLAHNYFPAIPQLALLLSAGVFFFGVMHFAEVWARRPTARIEAA